MLVHPFYKISRAAGHRQLAPREKGFLQLLAGSWKRAVLNAKRRKNSLFVLVGFPLANPEAKQAQASLVQFAKRHLGERFLNPNFSLTQNMPKRGPRPLSLQDPGFSGFIFGWQKPIKIAAYGEDLGNCPETQAEILAKALRETGHQVNVVTLPKKSVAEHRSIGHNIRRMDLAKKRPKRSTPVARRKPKRRVVRG